MNEREIHAITKEQAGTLMANLRKDVDDRDTIIAQKDETIRENL